MKSLKTICTATLLLAALVTPAAAQATAPVASAAPPPAEAKPAPSNSTSLAAQVNSELPEWVRFGGEYRFRFESVSGVKGVEDTQDGYALSRLRLDLLFKLGKHVRLFVQGQDSQVGGFAANPDPPIHENTFDLRQAWIEFRQSEKNGWAFKVGRQELNFGDQRLVGSLNWTNTTRTFDAAKLSYTNDLLNVDAFASSVVVIQDNVFDKHVDGANFFGLYANFFKVVPKGQVDAYAFWKTNPLVLDEKARLGDADTWTFGSRLAGKAGSRVDYGIEAVGQAGTFSTTDIRAAAFHGRLMIGLWKNAALPRPRVEYNYASGDSDPTDGRRGTFDQLFPTAHDKNGLIDQVGWKNIHKFRLGATMKPHARVVLDVDYSDFWLAEAKDGLFDAGGNLVARIITGAPDRHVAREFDVQSNITVANGVTLGIGYGHWFPGDFWKAATPGAARDFIYTSLTYRF
ncbi:MAG: alginate export family protein [Blastocatellia bacterium]